MLGDGQKLQKLLKRARSGVDNDSHSLLIELLKILTGAEARKSRVKSRRKHAGAA
jgi:hypothetical protein